MLTLKNGTLLYHGSYAQISQIDMNKCRPGKDFGRGFYVTSSYEQAKSFVPLSINKQVKEGNLPPDYSMGCISVFKFHMMEDVAIHTFDDADKEWLHFVASNRRNTLFPEVRKFYEEFDVIGGKIANDRTARTLQLYITGGYGELGSQTADDIAIMTLLPNRLEDQFCFRSNMAILTLEFIRGDSYDVNRE